MIDRERRNLYAEQVRHFAAGVLTVGEYEARTDDLLFGSQDSGINAVRGTIWSLYDDSRTERLRGAWALDSATRRDVARCILFLYSDSDYRWPEECSVFGGIMGGATILFAALSLGLLNPLLELAKRRRGSEHQERIRAFADVDCWPFVCRAELETALKRPKFFLGTAPTRPPSFWTGRKN